MPSKFVKWVKCLVVHRKYHARRCLSDGLSFQFMAGECVKCGRRWGGGRLAINPKTEESLVLAADEPMPDGFRWFLVESEADSAK